MSAEPSQKNGFRFIAVYNDEKLSKKPRIEMTFHDIPSEGNKPYSRSGR